MTHAQLYTKPRVIVCTIPEGAWLYNPWQSAILQFSGCWFCSLSENLVKYMWWREATQAHPLAQPHSALIFALSSSLRPSLASPLPFRLGPVTRSHRQSTCKSVFPQSQRFFWRLEFGHRGVCPWPQPQTLHQSVHYSCSLGTHTAPCTILWRIAYCPPL